MTRSQSQKIKQIRNRFQNSRRTQKYSEYLVRSNSSSSFYQYQSIYSNNQFFYHLDSRQLDCFEFQNRRFFSQTNDSRFFKEKPFASVLSSARQSLQITDENTSSNASGSSFSGSKSKDQYRNNRYRDNKEKERAYVTEKNEYETETNNSSQQENADYYHDSDVELNYYHSQDQNENELEANFFTSTRIFKCRKCKSIFSSNNQLHKHLRQNTCVKKSSMHRSKLEKATAHLIMNISIIESTVDSFKDVRIESEFRD